MSTPRCLQIRNDLGTATVQSHFAPNTFAKIILIQPIIRSLTGTNSLVKSLTSDRPITPIFTTAINGLIENNSKDNKNDNKREI